MKPIRLAILAMNPWAIQSVYQPINYAAYQIQASVMTDPELEGVEVYDARLKHAAVLG